MGFLLRWLFAFLLIAATFNPTRYNYIDFARSNMDSQLPLIVLLGLLLVAGYVIYLRATLRSIGTFGILLVSALVAAVVWVLTDYGLLSLDDPGQTVWLGIVALSLILGTGLSWSFIRRRLSGQVDVDDADE
ncbi:MAG: DUF6524 family protein [Brevirhabdus sp.]